MSVFVDTNHLFLRNPRGGVEDVASMAAAGFGAIFCNIGDFPPADWALIRERSSSAGVVCGPWLRTAVDGDTNEFDPERLGFLIDVAHDWGTPYIVNTEAEADGSGSDITQFIAEETRGDEAALSMQPWPFASVDWTPVGHMPILPQIFGPQWGADAEACRTEWFRCGAMCVVDTYGTYDSWTPDLYQRLSPYGLYTADDCANTFVPWMPAGSRDPYAPDGPPPTNGGTVPDDAIPMPKPGEKIGDQHGITALVDWLQAQDGMPQRTLSYDPAKPKTWPWPERIERTLRILAADHDAGLHQPDEQ